MKGIIESIKSGSLEEGVKMGPFMLDGEAGTLRTKMSMHVTQDAGDPPVLQIGGSASFKTKAGLAAWRREVDGFLDSFAKKLE